MRLPDLKKLVERKEQGPSPVNVTCKNCQTEFSGHFCPECGQSVKEFDKPFSFVFYNFVGDFFAFDTRFFKTFSLLIFSPGKLTSEFFAGKRVRYTPPFRIFIFVSFILFFVLQIYSNRNLTKVLDSSFNEGGIVSLDSMSISAADTIFSELKINADTSDNANLNSSLTNSGNVRQLLNNLSVYLENRVGNETNLNKKKKLREYIRLCRSPEDAWAKILEHMSWTFFFLLPVFTLILKLFYIRRKQNYVRHLIFSTHMHSFIFMDFFILFALNILFEKLPWLITTLLLLIIPVYFIIALKNFYGQKFGKVLIKFFGISLLYNFAFLIITGYVVLNALSLI